MQRMPPNMPPRQNGTPNQRPASPALNMAQRIRSEQGTQRAAQYLMDMEPYLAPAERAHIAEQIGVTLPQRRTQPQSQAQPQSAGAPTGGMPFGGIPNGGTGGGMPGGGNPMQLLQMLGGMPGGVPGGMPGGGNMGNMMQMLQTLGPLLGGKK
ncbi:MAG: hypothetical protein Q4E65_00225 [Clostridia bacterium]|nr:hypothetical protein [Clostridia bacterium]